MSGTPEDVARWMRDQVAEKGALFRELAVRQIREQFGEDFLHRNRDGNLAIDTEVLTAFAELTGDEVVWERGSLSWRKRARRHRTGVDLKTGSS